METSTYFCFSKLFSLTCTVWMSRDHFCRNLFLNVNRSDVSYRYVFTELSLTTLIFKSGLSYFITIFKKKVKFIPSEVPHCPVLPKAHLHLKHKRTDIHWMELVIAMVWASLCCIGWYVTLLNMGTVVYCESIPHTPLCHYKHSLDHQIHLEIVNRCTYLCLFE